MPRADELRQRSYKFRPLGDSQPDRTCPVRLFPGTKHPMITDQPLHPRKRQSRDWDQAQAQDWEYNNCKRRKRVDSTASQPPSAFWDNLSEVHLTRTALRELHRRNSATSPDRTNLLKLRRPVTRSLARLDTSPQTPITANNYTRQCSASTKNDLREFARRGGPDMTDERGVRISIPSVHNSTDISLASRT